MRGDREQVRKSAFSFLLFLAITLIVVVLIKIFNWLPLTFQNETLRRYSSIEQIKASLHINDIYVPTYFPQTISWPPEHLFAQSKPFPAIMMTFNRTNTKRAGLIITQSVSDSFSLLMPSTLDTITQRVEYEFHGRRALLEVGTCDNEPCSRITWPEEEYHLTVFMRSSPFELIKIAESMLR